MNEQAFDLIAPRASGQTESTARGRYAVFRAGSRIDTNPIYRTGILPNLLREDFGRRIRGVTAPCAQTPIHRLGRSRQPKTGKWNPSRLGDRLEGPALLGLQRYGIDDYRIPRVERIRCLSAQRPVDAARHLRGIGARRQLCFGGDFKQTLPNYVAAQDPRAE